MKKTILAVILITVLLTVGCTAPGAGSSGAQSDAASKEEKTVETAKEEVSEPAAAAGTGAAAATGTSGNMAAQTAAAAVTAQKGAEAAAATAGEAVSAEKTAEEETAAPEETDGAEHISEEASQAARTDISAADTKEEAAEQEEKKSAGLPDKVVPGGGAASAYVFPDYPEEPIPDYYTPYGVWTLVYDSGFEVKTRYSEAGLTYYKESEEFFFRLNKDLPDFRAETAHMLFNTAGPMDPAEAGNEVFPYEEGYVIYIQLDDGSAYQLSKWDLDLRGRIFVRELYESFRQKWEGAF